VLVKSRGFFKPGFAKVSFRTIASFFTTQPIGKIVTAVCASIFLVRYGGGRMRSFILVLGAEILAIIPGYAQDAALGEKIFVQCKACHQIGENAKNAVGPVLNGLFGRKAGTIEGYSYSPANKNSGITWDEATFREYIKDPRAKIPGTKMTFPGLKDPKQIDDIVAYLKQFDSTGKKTAGIVPAGRKLAKVQ
jgi:cytochrome c